MHAFRFALLAVVAVSLSACGGSEAEFEAHFRVTPSAPKDCGCGPETTGPWLGDVTLTPHTDEATFLASTTRFGDLALAKERNDWDLSLTPSTTSPDELTFRVNLVTDDRSCLEDLGPIALTDVPQRAPTCGDHLTVHEGHLYLVLNVDDDQRQLTVVSVTKLDGTRSATVRWFRSKNAEVFSLDW
jgi:hypothetical protein